MSKDILLFGVQGSGKGTQAERLENTFGYITIGMGNALREMSRQESPLGQQIKKNN
jgi:adenylate kinase